MTFFSVIITTYNRPTKILRAIKSVEYQTYDNWELVIVNDGSTADYSEVEEYIRDNKKIRYYFKLNEERSIARNYGIEHCNGQYICFLDDDDYYLENHLSVLYSRIQEEEFTPGIYHTLPLIKWEENNIQKHFMPANEPYQDNVNFYVRKGGIALNCICYSSELLLKYKFPPFLFIGEDKYQQLLSMTEYPVFFIPVHTSVYDRTEGNTWGNGLLKNSLEELRAFHLIFKHENLKKIISKQNKQLKLLELYRQIIVNHQRELKLGKLIHFILRFLYNTNSLADLVFAAKTIIKKLLIKTS